MALPGNGIFVVQGEIAMLVTAMRRSSRWGSHSNQNEDYDTLMKTFVSLRDVLKQVDDLRLLDPNVFFSPFLEVIRSEETTGPVTSLALSAVNKFLSYGLIDPLHPGVPATVENIADAVTHARFVGTDHSSDGIVLMKILQVLRTLMLSPEGMKMTDESVCEIMLSCFRICFETRLSELLRRNAEQCLRDMTQLVFMRLPQFRSEDSDLLTSGGTFSLQRRVDKASKRSRVAIAQDSMKGFGEDQGKQTKKLSPAVATTTADSTESNDKAGSKDKESQEDTTIEPPLEPEIASNSVKKHSRHSSMDLQLIANNSITELLEKCVGTADDASNNKEDRESKIDLNLSSETISEPATETQDVSTESIGPNHVDTSVELQETTDNKQLVNKDFITPRGIRFTADHKRDDHKPYGLVCVRELFRFLVMVCNPLDSQNTAGMLQLGLALIQTALEVGGDQLAMHPALLALVKDPLSRNLISLLSSDRVSIVAIDLQVSFLLFESLRPHLKLQMEAYFKRLLELIVCDNAKNSYEVKEITHLALESLTQMFRIPGLCAEMYLNFDCDIYCSNLFEDITKILSKNVVSSTLPSTQVLSLDALMAIVESIETNFQDENVKMMKPSQDSFYTARISESCDEHVSIDMEDEINDGGALQNINQFITQLKHGRHKPSENVPSDEHLEAAKNQKRWIAAGSELFNQKAEKGIEYLQEHGILDVPLNPHQMAMFLRENSGLDKKMIGEYICKRSSTSVLSPNDTDSDALSMANSACTPAVSVLSAFANSFEFHGLRIDQALRLYLETFRLPGEAPLIFLVMEHFSERWHTCNGTPFANTDAAFRLAYAIIMLNMDQHNFNAKKLNVPMTADDFVRNLRGCNGSGDFDQSMLEAVFNAIKNEEIVMPAERTGLVKENYLWKVLLRRSTAPYLLTPPGRYDRQLFSLTWGPTITALSSTLERCSANTNVSGNPISSANSTLIAATDALECMGRCAALAARLGHTDTLDTIVLGLCKFTGLLGLPDGVPAISVAYAVSRSVGGAALTAVAAVAARHAASLQAAWPPLFLLLTELYRARLLSGEIVQADDLCATDGKVSLYRTSADLENTGASSGGIFSSLYSYIALGEAGPTAEERRIIKSAEDTVQTTNLNALFVTETRFLPLEGLQELVKQVCIAGAVPPADRELPSDIEDILIFYLELLIKIVIQNRDRVSLIWPKVSEHIGSILEWGAELPHTGPGVPYFIQSCTSALLKAAVQLLRADRCTGPVLKTLQQLLLLKKEIFMEIAELVSVGVYELVRTAAQNIHSGEDWAVLFSLLAAAGAGRLPVPPDQSPAGSSPPLVPGPTLAANEMDDDNEGGWIMVVARGGIIVPPAATARCCAALALVVRDVAHVTPHNFPACVACVRTFVDAALKNDNMDRVPSATSANKSNQRQKAQAPKRAGSTGSRRAPHSPYYSEEDEDEEEGDSPDSGQMICIQLLDLIHTLHSRTAGVFAWWREEAGEGNREEGGAAWADLWTTAWLPLLRGIATLCLDVRKQVWSTALSYLQRALLAPGLGSLGGREWEQCCRLVLFPLLSTLVTATTNKRRRAAADAAARANAILCKVFLHHLSALSSQPTFPWVWLRVVSLQRALLVGNPTSASNRVSNGSPDDALREAALESLKNMILVMDSVKVFGERDDRTPLWAGTWQSIGEFLPSLYRDLFPQEVTPNQEPTPPPPPQMPPQSCQPPPSQQTQHQPQVGNLQTSQETVPVRSSVQKGGGSIILQPPVAPSQLHSPLFSHLGQMVSTPIGVAVPISQVQTFQTYPIICPKAADTPKNSLTTLTTQLPSNINYPCIIPQNERELNPSSIMMQQKSIDLINEMKSEVDLIVNRPRVECNTQIVDSLSNMPILKSDLGTYNEQIIDIGALSEEYLCAQAEVNTAMPENSLYGDYLIDPYSLQKDYIESIDKQIGAVPEVNEARLDAEFAPQLPQKSLSATASPLRDPFNLRTQAFVSTDNIPTPADSQSSIFNFANYFMSDVKSIPPGSEILFGDQFLPANEG